MCQVKCISDLGRKLSWINSFFQIRVKIMRKGKRNAIFLKNKIARILRLKSKPEEPLLAGLPEIRPGDLVRVRAKEEIRRMLDDREKYRGCLFIDEMYEHCGKNYKVMKVIDYFLAKPGKKCVNAEIR